MAAIQLAIVGADERAAPYLKVLSGREDVNVAAVCDGNLRAAEAAAAGWRAKVYPHFEPMLREVLPDALLACVPARLQGDLLALAVELNIPFLVEPPGAADFELARKLHTQICDRRLIVAVAHLHRAIDLVLESKEYLGINNVPLACGWWLADPENADDDASRLLWNDGCRLIDLLRYFCGGATDIAAVPSDSTGMSVIMRMENGTSASVVVASLPMAEGRFELELIGRGWYFRFTDRFSALRLVEPEKTTLLRQMNQPHADHVAAFLKAVIEKSPEQVLCGYEEAWQTMQICHAAIRAAREDCWIPLHTG